MKKCLFVSIVLLTTMGCNLPPDQRFDMLRSMIEQTQRDSEALDQKLVDMHEVLAEARTVLSDPNLTIPEREEVQKIIDTVMAGSLKIAEHKSKVDASIASWKAEMDDIASGGQIGFGEELQAWGKGLTEVGPLVPGVGGYALIGGSLLTAVGGLLSSRKNKQTAVGVVNSVGELLDSELVPDTMAAKKLLRKYQEAAGVRTNVDKLR